ncbi:hypothetical protein LshimejAT787_0407300 [Lyophyllum shimeji]|uniref:F-box domain-containing protein n=1 Tax=Lyophyllum shimeji TaxID=47721 RepID=A0A9P3PLL1_LYOSH|nr:hypothetical protein LshimejAT787_0407300 [Lyophyllum shimeji]
MPTKGALGKAIETGVGIMTGQMKAPGEIRTITKEEIEIAENLHKKRFSAKGQPGTQALTENIKRMKAMRSSRVVDDEADAALQRAELHLLRTLNSFTPPCAIPVELLSRVFELGQIMELEELADSSAASENIPSVCQPFEVLVTHISSHFRNVALATCLLWSRITVTPGARDDGQIESYLERSSECGLGVRMDLRGVDTPDALTMTKTAVVFHHSHRYRRLVIDAVRESVSQPVIRRLCRIVTPILEHLSLSVDEVEASDAGDDKVLQGGAPVLAFVRLRGVALPLFLPPLENVTTLHLDQTAPLPILYSTFHDMLTTPSFLTNLSIYGDIIAGHTLWPGIAHPVSLPHLRGLRICGVGGTIYSGLLLGINAPALESLVLKDMKERDLDHFWAASLHRICFPRLRNLSVLDCDVSRDVFADLFRGFPSISAFTTAAYHMTTPTVLLLLAEPQQEGSGIPWPKLHTLTLLVNLHDAEHVVVDVARQRKASGYPLKKLRLGTTEPLASLPQYAWLKDNVALERFVDFDGWPRANADFDADPDDILFR